MNAKQRSLLRDSLLLALHESSPTSLDTNMIKMSARYAGFTLSDEDAQREMDYLCDKGLAERKVDPLSAGLKLWKLTAAGRDYLEGKDLV